jgi:quinol-cytochrome oxidoreductase complex cytochrome b subunit/NADH:ubiquinone oxidoreductase subunit 2 (subunit N)
MWSFGSLAGMALITQIITGVLLAMHYAPEIHLAFSSVEHIMRDVRGGVALRYIHANGASMFFIVVYLHMFRALYYGSYFQPRANLWYSGIIIFFLMMAAAFMGYVLPWGQMSFWGATVITNLFSAIPIVGNSIVQLLWGGFSVDNPTLNRFFSLHYLVPFLIAALAILHLVLLHQHGSNNPLGILGIYDKISFYPYYYVKDLFAFFVFIWIFSFFVIYAPNYMGHPDNYIEANPLVTPAHIVPEWYFLPFYAVLRTIPDKLGGVSLMGLSIIVLALLPIVDTSVFRSNFFKPLNIWFFWFFFSDSLSLGWIGQEVVESPFIEMANFVTLSYFLYFIPLLPIIGFLENAIIHYELRYAVLTLPIKSSPLIIEVDEYTTCNINDKACGINLIRPMKIKDVELIKEANVPIKENLDLTEILVNVDPITKVTFELNNDKLSIFNIFINNKINFIDTCMNQFLFLHSWIHVLQLGFIIVFLLLLGTRYTRTGEFALLLNKLACIYLFFNVWMSTNLITINPADLFQTELILSTEDALYFQGFVLIASLTVVIFFYGIIDRFFISNSYETEYPIIVLLIFLGAVVLFRVQSFIDFIIAIEIVTFGTYVLVAYEQRNRFSVYAGVQYFILGSIPSAMLILSISWIYVTYGLLNIRDLDIIANIGTTCNLEIPGSIFLNLEHFQLLQNTTDLFILENISFNNSTSIHNLNINWNDVINSLEFNQHKAIGILLFFSYNLLFKLTAAPFHFWALSIYEKAPITSVTILSIFTKLMVILLILKVFYTAFFAFKTYIAVFYIFLGLITAIFAIVGAFITPTIKKFFVYSSMGHVAFMLIPIALFNLGGAAATIHYLIIYVLSSFIMWFILFLRKRDNHALTFFKQFKTTDPILGFVFSMLIFSMSGIPPFGGFFVKLDVLITLIENSNFFIAFILFFCTVASFFYYLRLIKIIYFDSKNEYVTGNIFSAERLLLIIILFLLLTFYSFLVQMPLLFTELEFLTATM